MFAAIRRYEVGASSTNTLADLGWRFGKVMTQVSGLVATLALEASGGAFVTICLFEDRASLEAAAPIAEQWTSEHRAVLGSSVTELVTREVVSQRGL